MIDEVLFMETRVFSEFCKRKKISAKTANNLFNTCKIWEYIEKCYDILHLNGDENVLNDVDVILAKQGVNL